MRGALRFVVAFALLAPATATATGAERHEHGGGGIAGAREAHRATRPPETVAGGAISVLPTEGLAGQLQTVTIELASGAAGVSVDFPGRFQAHAINGRSYVPGRPTGASLTPDRRAVTVDVSGLPAGTYSLPVRRAGRLIGTAVFRLYAQRKEGGTTTLRGPFGPLQRAVIDTSNDNSEESETFVAVDPADTNRIVTYGNDISNPGTGGVSITTDGGATAFSHLTFPTTFDVKGTLTNESATPSGDPILAADSSGNIWAGGLSVCKGATSADRIFVNRIGAGTTLFQPNNVGLPELHGGTVCGGPNSTAQLQDKPQMTIDNTSISPTYGRLYVTWDDPAPLGGVNEVISYCDTRPQPTQALNAALCDSADNWTNPAVISDADSNQGGSYITSDPAVGPDGKVYVAWWDYSAANAVRIDTCDPALHNNQCNAAADWGTDQIVASLTVHSGQGVPFACPTIAQPGGRAAPVPSLAVDHSGGANNGRIYIGWGDLTTSGADRCSDVTDSPDITQDTFHAYVASAPDFSTLTANPATTSYQRGTNVIGDTNADHWFPWVAVDQSTGQAYVDLYSTRGDATRATSRFYVRAVVPQADSTRPAYGPLTEASTDASDYSNQQCCDFGNQYGDYTGLDAAGGKVLAVWTHRLLGGDGDVYLNVLTAGTGAGQVAATPTEVPTDDSVTPFPPPPPPPPPPPTTTTTTTPPPPPPPPPVDRTPPLLRVVYATRADRKGRYTLRFAAAGEKATGRVRMQLLVGKKRRTLATGRFTTAGTKSVRLVLKLRRSDLALLKRRHRLRIRLTVSLADVAGNTAQGTKTLTLRLSRR